MSSAIQTAFVATIENSQPSKGRAWAGRILSGVPLAFLLMDGVMKLFTPAPVVEGMKRLGYPVSLSPSLGIVLLACVAAYLIPRTSLLGAILLTGYLGGAVATHVRVGDPLFSHVLFPIYFGILLWAGLFLRDGRLTSLFTRAR
jgi:hypothetical protein